MSLLSFNLFRKIKSKPLLLRFDFHKSILFAVLTCKAHADVNDPRQYPIVAKRSPVQCHVDVSKVSHSIDNHIYGTNLEWYNDAGGLININGNLNDTLIELAKNQQTTLYRFPGGTLSDFYNWTDGIGPLIQRKSIKHPTDIGYSVSRFGTPEFAKFLSYVGGDGLVTVNAGTGTAEQAAAWVSYTNSPNHPLRIADGFDQPMNIKLWEIGNELYLPGNPTDIKKITVTPSVYADRFLSFSHNMRKVDSSIKLLAIGNDRSHVGPWSEYTSWTETVLQKAASDIDYVAIHNAYFPMLFKERKPSIDLVYTALMAAPEAVDKSLTNLEMLIEKYQQERDINIAITEWGTLYSLPKIDPYWVDHVKTQGSAVYVARLLQVFLSHPKVKISNYFKFTDQFYMGWVGYNQKPKVPYWAFSLFSQKMRGDVVSSTINSDSFDTPQVGGVPAMSGLKDLTVVSVLNKENNKLLISLVNRSLFHQYDINLQISNFFPSTDIQLFSISTPEITSHNGRDAKPEITGYKPKFEPYSSVAPDSIGISTQLSTLGENITIKPFSIMVVEVNKKID